MAPVSPTLGPTVVLQALLGVASCCVLCGMSSAHLSDTAASLMWSSRTVLNGAGPQARVGGGEAAEWLFAFLCHAEPKIGNRSELLVPVPVVGPFRPPTTEGGWGCCGGLKLCVGEVGGHLCSWELVPHGQGPGWNPTL